MKALHIGIQTAGTTSFLRYRALQRLLPTAEWLGIDTDSVFLSQPRWSRTMAFRFRAGPAVWAINKRVSETLRGRSLDEFDLIWVDKGVYLWPATVQQLRALGLTLIHYTPDAAFMANRSRFFEATLDLYDCLVTTKSFELERYQSRVSLDKVALVTQSFDRAAHNTRVDCDQKRREAVLIGLCERDRIRCVETLLDSGIAVRLGGQGWERTVANHAANDLLRYEGPKVFGQAYVDALANAAIGLGLLTKKRFQELHTTRTFEIPACGTLLATEANEETSRYFSSEEALFFSDYDDLAQEITALLEKPQKLSEMTQAGHVRITKGGFSNDCVLSDVLKQSGVPTYIDGDE